MSRPAIGLVVTATLAVCLAGCGDSGVAWPAYSDGYSAGAEYDGAKNETRDHCRALATERIGEADNREDIAFVYGCGQAANGVPKETQASIEENYEEVLVD